MFQTYKRRKRLIVPKPLDHQQIGDITHTAYPDYDAMLKKVLDTPVGTQHATAYHHAIADLLAAIFYPSLSNRQVEFAIHNGRKRIDIAYTNSAPEGFFHWLVNHMVPSKYVFVECKNYGRDVANPELDQLSSRFSQLRGMVGLLTCRAFENKDLFYKRCRDTALDGRGYVLAIDDEDLKQLVANVKAFDQPDTGNDSPPDGKRADYPLLHDRFRALLT